MNAIQPAERLGDNDVDLTRVTVAMAMANGDPNKQTNKTLTEGRQSV